MEQLNGTVLTTALPSMARSFRIDPLHMSVALTSYLAARLRRGAPGSR